MNGFNMAAKNEDTEDGVALAILRDNKRLAPSKTFVLEEGEGTVIGRLGLLSLQHLSCGCRNDNRILRTQNRCQSCTAVNTWAASSLSRRLLKFSIQKGKISLQGRGVHARIFVDSKQINNQSDDWGEIISLEGEMNITIRPTKGEGAESLHILVNRVEAAPVARRKPTSIDTRVVSSDLKNDTLKSTDENTNVPGERSARAMASVERESSVETTANDSDQQQTKAECLEMKSTSQQPSNVLNDLGSGSDHDAVESPRKRKSGRDGSATKGQYSLFFVPLGQDLPAKRRYLLGKHAETFGFKVVQDVNQATHLIVSGKVQKLDEISEVLAMDEIHFRSLLEQNDVICAKPSWVQRIVDTGKVTNPGLIDGWNDKSEPRRSSRRGKKRPRIQFKRNLELAEVFRKLSEMHQSSPLFPLDQWKAYMFRIISGRLTHLDFEITSNPETLDRLRKVPGIGDRSVLKIEEYLETDSVSRIEAFETDKARVAMRNMMAIWGVGPSTARNLVECCKYRTIEDVRSGIRKGNRSVNRSQLVGVECYEDFLEEMDRSEVTMIGYAVRKVVLEVLPSAEVQIMGSYRRGKASCGDVDIHISHPKYFKKVPQEKLSEIIDRLWEYGYLSFHLTFFPFMTTGSKTSDYAKSSRFIPRDAWEHSKAAGGYQSSQGHRYSSYMGVFKSPKVSGRRRRIDIKIYPWRERIFATIYFTGNGFFNRSMRLWATRKYGLLLNDQGLFRKGTGERVMEASSEKEVFDKLNLLYKEPHERDCFDAVISKEGVTDCELDLSGKDFEEDYRLEAKTLQWVK